MLPAWFTIFVHKTLSFITPLSPVLPSFLQNPLSRITYMKHCRDIAYPGTIKTLTLGVATAKVAEDEGLEVDPLDVQDQMDLRRLEAERQGMDEQALKNQIEAKLLADKVLDFLAEHADITYVDAKEA